MGVLSSYLSPSLALHKKTFDFMDHKVDLFAESSSQYFDRCYIKNRQDFADSAFKHPNNIRFRTLFGNNSYGVAWKSVESIILKMHLAGIKLVTGTDTNTNGVLPGFSIHDEMQLLNQAGISTLDTLKIATYNGAQMLGLKNVGYIRKGAIAELVVLDSNPVENITNTRTVSAVIRKGRLWDRKALKDIELSVVQRASAFNSCPVSTK